MMNDLDKCGSYEGVGADAMRRNRLPRQTKKDVVLAPARVDAISRARDMRGWGAGY